MGKFLVNCYWVPVFLVIVVLTLAGCSEDERASPRTVPKELPVARAPHAAPVAEVTETKPPPAVDLAKILPYEEWLMKTITEVAGEKSNLGKPRVQAIFFWDKEKTDMEISFWADDHLTLGLIRDGATIDSALILRRIFDDPRAKKVTLFWWYPLKTAAGQEGRMLVIRVRMTRETADKINWNEFRPRRLPDVADDFHVHPSMQ